MAAEATMIGNDLMLHPWESGFKLPDTFNMVSLLLERHLAGPQSERSAIIHKNETISYGELGCMANRIGNGLRQLGVAPGDRVILLLHDRPEFIALFLGAMKIGAVPVPINMLATAEDLDYFINDSQAAVVVVESELHTRLTPIIADAAHLKTVVVHGAAVPGTTELSQMMKDASDQLDVYPTAKTDHSYWLYTSGTTGRPKGVVHYHKDLVHAVEAWGQHVVQFTPEDRVLCSSKLFFSYGLNNALYLPLYYGASVILNPDRPLPEVILGLIEKHRPTGFFSVPTAYGQILNYLEAINQAPDLSSLRFCISAGEALPGSLFQRWKKKFDIDILDGLGSSEAGFIYISNRPGIVKENASGLALPGYAIEVRDELGKPLPAGELGELYVSSQTLFAEYWQKPDKTAETLVNGWMKTGDMGHIDAEGYFFYSARANDSMKVSGIWVSPLEVENALLSHPSVAECAVVAMQDAMDLIKPKAFVALKSGHTPSDDLGEALKRHVKEKLAPYKYPRVIEFVDDLPKTATGKIQRFKLRERP
ncbi:Benzoate--CoA ligase [Desulfosarcina cetonica]|nr:Benzoate--CoA ligase [Desulfosarcina cetonica]